MGDSDIVARVDRDEDGAFTFAERWSFPTLAMCHMTSDGQLEVGGRAWGTRAAIWFSVDANLALSSSAPLVPTRAAFSKDSLFFYDYESSLAWAYAVSGQVMLSGSLSVGSEIEGYVQTELRPVMRYPDQVAYGVPCTDGLAACGGRMDVICSPIDASPLCSTVCGCDRECKLGGAVCVKAGGDTSGLCLRACTGDSDCALPLRCVTKEGMNVCA